jgi:putative ABC transport system permease protein
LEWQIVGIYRDAHNHGLLEPDPEIEVSFWQNPWPSPRLAVRTANDPTTMTKSIAAAIRDIDPTLPMADIETIDEVVQQLSAGERFGVVLFGSFAAVGLMLAVFGVYGVMAFTVAQRTREIGLRIALGAGHGQILRLFLSEGVTLGLIGLVIGGSGAYAVGRLMRGMWYGTAAGDPIIFIAVASVLLASAVMACYIPARRAAKVDPMVALRYE